MLPFYKNNFMKHFLLPNDIATFIEVSDDKVCIVITTELGTFTRLMQSYEFMAILNNHIIEVTGLSVLWDMYLEDGEERTFLKTQRLELADYIENYMCKYDALQLSSILINQLSLIVKQF